MKSSSFILFSLLLLRPMFISGAEAGSDPAAPSGETTTNSAAGAEGEDEGSLMSRIQWMKGPAKAQLRDLAEIQVPAGYMMTGAKGTRELLEAMGNPTSGEEMGFLAPTNLSWFVVFRFSDVGYVKDDDKDKLKPDQLLKTIREGTEEGNKYRAKMGAPPMKIIGWEYPPKYNEQTHNLEWAVRGESEGQAVVNYNTRLLGRKGVMESKLVIEPEKLSATLPVYQGLLKDFHYQAGETYAEYRKGDRLAKYGLAALITGGAAAVALKTGLLSTIILFFKKGIKLIVVAVAAVAAWIKRLVLGKPRREALSAPPDQKA